MASLQPSQKSPTLSSSDTAIAPTYPAGPLSTLAAAPPASPDSNVVAMMPVPTTMIIAMLRSAFQGKPGRRAMGTPQAVLSAFWAAPATPRAPRNVRMSPMTSAGPVSFSGCTVLCSCVLITGNCPNAEFSTFWRSTGSWLSTSSSTVTKTSSRGKIDANA